MTKFKLDPRLENDCLVLGELNSSLLLLMDNALLPWFILVPQTSEIEIIDLPQSEQQILQESIYLLATFVRTNFKITKLNIAAIGNVVSQLHVHIVGRDPSDYCWPNVVWGTTQREDYSRDRIVKITEMLKKHLRDSGIILY